MANFSHAHAREARPVRQSVRVGYNQMLELRALIDAYLDACEDEPKEGPLSIGEIWVVSSKRIEILLWLREATLTLDGLPAEGSA